MEIIIKGNLEMCVAAYACLEQPPCEEDIVSSYPVGLDDYLFVMYVGSNPFGFFERIGAPEEYQDFLMAQAELDLASPTAIRAFGLFLPGYCEGAIRSGLEDVIKLDDQSMPSECVAATQSALGIYIFFKNISRIKKEEENYSVDDLFDDADPVTNEVDHYTRITKPIDDHLVDDYLVPLVRAYHHDDEELLDRIKQDLYEFAQDALFEADVCELSDEIRIGGDINYDLVVAYVDKIKAIYHEQYEQAGELRDKIYRIKCGEEGKAA